MFAAILSYPLTSTRNTLYKGQKNKGQEYAVGEANTPLKSFTRENSLNASLLSHVT